MDEAKGNWVTGNLLELEGRLDQCTVTAVRRDTDAALIGKLANPGKVVVDFSGVTRADSAALSLILHWMRLSRAGSGTLELAALPEQIRALARTSRMEHYLVSDKDG